MTATGTNLTAIERKDTMTRAKLDGVAEYARARDQEQYDRHIADGKAAQAEIDAADALASNITEFIGRVLAKSPQFDQGAHTEALTAKVSAAAREFFAAVQAYNTEVAIVSDEAKALGLTSRGDGPVVFIPGLGVHTGLHVRGHKVQRQEHLTGVAERAAISGVRRGEAEAGR